MNVLLALALMLCLNAASAQGLVIHGPSAHFSGSYNNLNVGVGYLSSDGWAAGLYRNSERATSAYLTRRFQLTDTLSIAVGGATGYRGIVVAPLAAALVTVPLGTARLVFGVMPFYDQRLGLVVHSMIEIPLDDYR